MIIDNNFGNLCMKKGGSFQKERFSFFQSSMGGFDPRNPPPPPVRTPLLFSVFIGVAAALLTGQLGSGQLFNFNI